MMSFGSAILDLTGWDDKRRRGKALEYWGCRCPPDMALDRKPRALYWNGHPCPQIGIKSNVYPHELSVSEDEISDLDLVRNTGIIHRGLGGERRRRQGD